MALASRLFPNSVHSRLLRSVQPHRKEEDVFPTAYKLNRPKAVRQFFGAGVDVFHYTTSAVPSYHFGSYFVFRSMLLLHRLLPPMFDRVLGLFIRKHERGGDA